VERAVLAGEALADDLRILVDENGHATPTFQQSSWPGLSRPYTPCWLDEKKDMDARHKAGHDGRKLSGSNITQPPS
jgi:error-prone DNA polymerase